MKKRNHTHRIQELIYRSGTWTMQQQQTAFLFFFFLKRKHYLHGPNSSISDTTAEFGTREQSDVKHRKSFFMTSIYDKWNQWSCRELHNLENLNLKKTKKLTNIKLPPRNLDAVQKIESCSFFHISFQFYSVNIALMTFRFHFQDPTPPIPTSIHL